MSEFCFRELELEGAYIINNFSVGDNRGGFTKFFEKNIYRNAGIEFQVSEMFISKSSKNVIRGMHFQIEKPQAKLVSVVKGKVWDVIVDLRPTSATYKKHISVLLSEDNHRGLFIPRGFAHGFATLEEDTYMMYMCDGEYNKQTDTGIVFNDPELMIDWPIEEDKAILSKRDLKLLSFVEYERIIMGSHEI